MRWLQYQLHWQVNLPTVVSLSSAVVMYFIYIFSVLDLKIGLWVSLLGVERLIILSRVRSVTIDGMWMREWIYWPRLVSTSNYRATANLQKTPQHNLSLFQPSVASPVISWQPLLTVEIVQLAAVRFFLHKFPYKTDCQLSTELVAQARASAWIA
jgi:hypothetical protein